MADAVRCSECGVRLKVPDGKTTVRCPKCGAKVRIPEVSEDEDEPVKKTRSRQPAADETRPPKSKRRREDNMEDDDDDRPRRRSRDDDDEDEEEDDRPRKRSKRSRAPTGDGPWLLAALGSPVCFFLAIGIAFLIYGKAGLPAGNDGPGGKIFGLGLGLLVSFVLLIFGTLAVKNRQAYSKWGTEIKGGMAVALGMVQAILGGFIGGFCVYGLVFMLLNGR